MLISRQKSGNILIEILLNCQSNHMPSILGEQMFTLAFAQYVKTRRETGGRVYTIEYCLVPYKQKPALSDSCFIAA